jgi:hypothetical protein
MAIWTLESDNGTGDMGELPVICALATIAAAAHCSRANFLAALKIGFSCSLTLQPKPRCSTLRYRRTGCHAPLFGGPLCRQGDASNSFWSSRRTMTTMAT